jgi:hypothetical protein
LAGIRVEAAATCLDALRARGAEPLSPSKQKQ